MTSHNVALASNHAAATTASTCATPQPIDLSARSGTPASRDDDLQRDVNKNVTSSKRSRVSLELGGDDDQKAAKRAKRKGATRGEICCAINKKRARYVLLSSGLVRLCVCVWMDRWFDVENQKVRKWLQLSVNVSGFLFQSLKSFSSNHTNIFGSDLQ